MPGIGVQPTHDLDEARFVETIVVSPHTTHALATAAPNFGRRASARVAAPRDAARFRRRGAGALGERARDYG